MEINPKHAVCRVLWKNPVRLVDDCHRIRRQIRQYRVDPSSPRPDPKEMDNLIAWLTHLTTGKGSPLEKEYPQYSDFASVKLKEHDLSYYVETLALLQEYQKST